MAITLKNRSNIKDGSLIKIGGPVPFTVSAEASYGVKLSLNIYEAEDYSKLAQGTLIISNLSLAESGSNGSVKYFTADIASILRSVYKVDDELQYDQTWKSCPELLHDFVIVVDAWKEDDTTDTASMHVEFTGLYAVAQFGQENFITTIDKSVMEGDSIITENDLILNTHETLYAAPYNVVYFYAIRSDEGTFLDESVDLGYYFVDSDGTYFEGLSNGVYKLFKEE